MRARNSTPIDQASTVIMPRVLLISYRAAMEPQEARLVARLITDLLAVGVDVLLDEMQDIHTLPVLKFQSCDWVLLVQMQNNAAFAQAEVRLNKAIEQNGRGRLRGILRVSVAVYPVSNALPELDAPIVFDASSDYPRALAGIVNTLHPDNQARLYGVRRGTAPPVIHQRPLLLEIAASTLFSSPRTPARVQRIHIILIVLTVLIVLGAILARALIVMPAPKVVQHPLTAPTMTAVISTPQELLYKQITGMKPAFVDTLGQQDAYKWDQSQQQGESCAFSAGAYQVEILPPAVGQQRYVCLEHAAVFTSLALQVSVKLVQGDVGGIVLRANGYRSYYWFSLDSAGCYRLVMLAASGQLQILSQDAQSCLGINMQNTNSLTAIAQGTTLSLYINSIFIKQFQNIAATSGQVGFVVIRRKLPTRVVFTNFKVWQLA